MIDPKHPGAAQQAINQAAFQTATGFTRPDMGLLPDHFKQAMKADFRKFLWAVFTHLGHEPSEMQYDIARFLQHGPRRSIICGFRGVGKSWITACYALWILYVDPQLKVLVVSASGARAMAFTNFCIALINEVPFLKFLQPGYKQRQSSVNFDVGPARPDQQPSLKALGITSQLPGNRADVIIPDDVETPQTAGTTIQREKLLEAIKEFAAIIKPNGKIRYLGTPQTEETIYVKLEHRGYQMRIWPSEYPDERRIEQYGHRLAPYIKALITAHPDRTGKPLEPRFNEEDLEERKLEWGRAGYALQFMLDTSLSDEDRYPLRLGDLIVTGLDLLEGPDTITWGKDDRLVHKNLPVLGFDRDRYYAPANISSTYSKWEYVAGFLDPSGRGADEAAFAAGATLNGRAFVLNVGGWRKGFDADTLIEIARRCVLFRLQMLRIESNFGDGMYGKLLKPYLDEAWEVHNKGKNKAEHLHTGIEEERAGSTQKELRMLEILGPATQQHRVIVAESVIQEDYDHYMMNQDIEADKRLHYSWAWQHSHLTMERDCLPHDDRAEAVAGLINIFAPQLGLNPKTAAKDRDNATFMDKWNKFMEGAKNIAGGVRQDKTKREGFKFIRDSQTIRGRRR